MNFKPACHQWFATQTATSLQMVKFLVDAGADPDFTANTSYVNVSRYADISRLTKSGIPTMKCFSPLL